MTTVSGKSSLFKYGNLHDVPTRKRLSLYEEQRALPPRQCKVSCISCLLSNCEFCMRVCVGLPSEKFGF